jgi:hypothetical protein
MTSMPEAEPADSQPAASGPYETGREARRAAQPLPEDPHQWPGANERQLRAAIGAAGVTLGTYDEAIVRWLATWEPTTCAVIAGLITRAHQAGTVSS